MVPAGEYHDCDFGWEGHAAEARPLLEARLAQREKAEAAGEEGEEIPTTERADYLSAWEAFHSKDNGTSRFYKERRYLPLAFPILSDEATTRHVFEIGCGAGSALLPVLRANPSAFVSGCDVSPRAVSAFLEAARSAGLDTFPPSGEGEERRARRSRVAAAAVLDAASADAPSLVTERLSTLGRSGGAGAGADLVPPGTVDAVLLVFTLGALDRDGQVAALRTAAAALRAGREERSGESGTSEERSGESDGGGSASPSLSRPKSSPRVLVRDHGLFDVAHMRAPRRISGNLHSRSDGTLCYFFSPEDLIETAKRAGLREVEGEDSCRWATVERRNRRSGQVLRRVFVHGEFELDE